MHDLEVLFPSLQRYVRETGLDRAKGSLSAKLPRVLGQGTTRATGMDAPPSVFERKLELSRLEFPSDSPPPQEVWAEVRDAERDVKALLAELSTREGLRRFATECLRSVGDVATGISNGHYYADRLVLTDRKRGAEWAWAVTPHYPIIDRLPPDVGYVAAAFREARAMIKAMVLPADAFCSRLLLAWAMAREFSTSEQVLATDVMKMYQVAGQDARFWQNPKRALYKDLPEAAFVVNLLNWRAHASSQDAGFTFVPATLSQASGANASVFYMPLNAEGTEVRPMIYIKRSA
jgi:hypothetical protein